MKICFFIAEMSGFGGTQRASVTIANSLSAIPEVSEVIMLGLMGSADSDFPIHDRVRRASLFPRRLQMTHRYALAIYRLRKFIRSHSIDVLVIVESSLALFAIPAGIGFSTRLICWEHFNFLVDVGRKKRTLARHLAALFSDDVVTLTERDQSIWRRKTLARANICAIANPSAKLPFERIYPEKSKTVLAVGRLSYQKGFDILIESWAHVVKRNICGDWKLVIVGSGELQQEIERQIQESGLRSSVSIRPATIDINSEYDHAAIVCCSSRYEGLPMVLIEAQQHGVPVVSFDIDTGPREIIVDNETGVLVPAGDPAALADALCALMLDESRRREMSTNAVLNGARFDTDVIMERWCRLLALPSPASGLTARGAV